MLRIIASIAFFGAKVCVADPASDQLRYYLETANCEYLANARSIDLLVLNRRFSLLQDFSFRGFEMNGVTFRRNIDLNPVEYLDLHPGATVKDAEAYISERLTSVSYYKVEDQEDPVPEVDEFDSFEWQGMTLLYRVTVGGQQIETTVHQVIARIPNNSERLRITATEIEQIASIVGCASEYE